MKKFESQFYENVDELVEGKDNAQSAHKTRQKRLQVVRKFSNGLATMTKKRAAELGVKEITNHLTSYSKLAQQESQFHSMATASNQLVEVVVDMDEPESDQLVGMKVAKALNEGAFNFQGAFAAFWKEVSGETVISGGVPCVWPSKYGWLPEVSLDMVFPRGTSLRPKKATHAFEPKEYTLEDLREIMTSIGDRDSDIFNKNNLEFLIEVLKQQIGENIKAGQDHNDEEKARSVREEETDSRIATLSAWVYYEIKFNEDKNQHFVSKTIFVDDIQASSLSLTKETEAKLPKGNDGASMIIAYVEKAFDSPGQWLWNMFVDSEIGGRKTHDEKRGIAEIIYPSTAEVETLLNSLLEGDKARARPKFKLTSKAKEGDIAQWSLESDTYIPEGVEEAEIKSNAQHLQTPITMLDGNAASIAGSPVSNRSGEGELRQQAVERQDVSSNVQANRINEAYTHMEAIVGVAVWRLLAGPVKAGVDGYEEAMWIRAKLEAQGIDPKVIATQEYGRFKYIRVRVQRTIGNGDRQQQVASANKVMENIQHIEPATRPIVIQRAFALWTGDPDLAEAIVRPPQVILNQQRIEAENEYTTVTHRAKAGMTIAPQPENIHHLHIESHLLDMQAAVAGNELRPWDLLDTVGFAAMVEHTGAHLKILLGNPATNHEGNKYLQAYQQVVSQAKPAITAVQQDQGEQSQLTEKERADIEIAIARLDLDAQKFGLQAADLADLSRIRGSRAALADRAQYTGEIEKDRRFRLDQQKAIIDARETPTAPDAKRIPAPKTPATTK